MPFRGFLIYILDILANFFTLVTSTDKYNILYKSKQLYMSKKTINPEKIKMVRIGEKEHAMLKKLAPWQNMSMQELLEELVRKEFKKAFPT